LSLAGGAERRDAVDAGGEQALRVRRETNGIEPTAGIERAQRCAPQAL
jgi:hypothetical protein